MKRIQWLTLLVLVTSGCGRFGGPGAGRSAATATPTPAQRLEAAATRTTALSSFHFLLTHQNGASNIVLGLAMTRADGDFVKPDRLRATVNASFQGFPVMVKVINVGTMTWITNPLQGGDRYQLVPSGTEAAAILDPSTGILKAARNVHDPRLSGTEKLDNADAYMIQGTVDAGDLGSVATDAQAGKLVPVRVWIGAGDSLIHRIRLEGPLSDAEPKGIVRQIDLSKFDEQIDVAPPAQ